MSPAWCWGPGTAGSESTAPPSGAGQEPAAGVGALLLLALMGAARILYALPALGLQLFVGWQLAYGGRRSAAGVEALGDLLSLRRFLRHASPKRLHQVLKRDPGWLQTVLPYAQQLGLSDRLGRVLGSTRVEEPAWLRTDEPCSPLPPAAARMHASCGSRAQKMRIDTAARFPEPGGGRFIGGLLADTQQKIGDLFPVCVALIVQAPEGRPVLFQRADAAGVVRREDERSALTDVCLGGADLLVIPLGALAQLLGGGGVFPVDKGRQFLIFVRNAQLALRFREDEHNIVAAQGKGFFHRHRIAQRPVVICRTVHPIGLAHEGNRAGGFEDAVVILPDVALVKIVRLAGLGIGGEDIQLHGAVPQGAVVQRILSVRTAQSPIYVIHVDKGVLEDKVSMLMYCLRNE